LLLSKISSFLKQNKKSALPYLGTKQTVVPPKLAFLKSPSQLGIVSDLKKALCLKDKKHTTFKDKVRGKKT